jgi:hypothetical protein
MCIFIVVFNCHMLCFGNDARNYWYVSKKSGRSDDARSSKTLIYSINV